MRRLGLPSGGARWALSTLLGVALLGAVGAGLAAGERTQKGDLIVSLDGGLSPLALPRERPAPVAVHLESDLRAVAGKALPRVTRIELGLPAQGVLSTRGLPTCAPPRLRNAKPPEALAACRDALVGRGRLQAEVKLPNQEPFTIQTRLLAFNGRPGGRRGVILHAFAADPPTVAVLPVRLRQGSGRFGLGLVADLPRALGPWPRLASFELTLSRRYSYRGRSRSYLSASCPVPPRFSAGFFSFARVDLTIAGGRQIATGIARSCRAR